jgi:hypothetical protein
MDADTRTLIDPHLLHVNLAEGNELSGKRLKWIFESGVETGSHVDEG